MPANLEHIWDEWNSFPLFDRPSAARSRLFSELPDVTRILREVAFWDVYYEHCSYFSAGSLARLFTTKEFDVTEVFLALDDQYLLLYADPSEGALPLVPDNDDYPQCMGQDVMNPIYFDEINELVHGLGIDAELVAA